MPKAKLKSTTTSNRPAQRRLRMHRRIRAIAIEVHTAALIEVRRREKSDDGINGLYENGTDRLMAAMEGIAKHIIKHYRPNDKLSHGGDNAQ